MFVARDCYVGALPWFTFVACGLYLVYLLMRCVMQEFSCYTTSIVVLKVVVIS